jgi:hypothetical protein
MREAQRKKLASIPAPFAIVSSGRVVTHCCLGIVPQLKISPPFKNRAVAYGLRTAGGIPKRGDEVVVRFVLQSPARGRFGARPLRFDAKAQLRGAKTQ